jgi:carbonic anhydrase
MSLLLQQIEEANRDFVARHALVDAEPVAKYPKRNLAVLACMDTRLLSFLEPAMGLNRGEAKIIKVAGNTSYGVFDSVIGSLMVAVYELQVQEIVVMGHDDCGMLKTTAASLCEKMRLRGIAAEAIEAVRPQLRAWADPIGDVTESVLHTVHQLRSNPYLPEDVLVHGAVIHPHTGEITIVSDGSLKG